MKTPNRSGGKGKWEPTIFFAPELCPSLSICFLRLWIYHICETWHWCTSVAKLIL